MVCPDAYRSTKTSALWDPDPTGSLDSSASSLTPSLVNLLCQIEHLVICSPLASACPDYFFDFPLEALQVILWDNFGVKLHGQSRSCVHLAVVVELMERLCWLEHRL